MLCGAGSHDAPALIHKQCSRSAGSYVDSQEESNGRPPVKLMRSANYILRTRPTVKRLFCGFQFVARPRRETKSTGERMFFRAPIFGMLLGKRKPRLDGMAANRIV